MRVDFVFRGKIYKANPRYRSSARQNSVLRAHSPILPKVWCAISSTTGMTLKHKLRGAVAAASEHLAIVKYQLTRFSPHLNKYRSRPGRVHPTAAPAARIRHLAF